MFEEILSPEAINVIESRSPHLDSFYLTGGTGLALQLGHRRSDDLHFFSDRMFNTDAINKFEKNFKEEKCGLGGLYEFCACFKNGQDCNRDAVSRQGKRRQHFGREIKFETIPKHIRMADVKHNLGTSDLNQIKLTKLGWKEDSVI